MKGNVNNKTYSLCIICENRFLLTPYKTNKYCRSCIKLNVYELRNIIRKLKEREWEGGWEMKDYGIKEIICILDFCEKHNLELELKNGEYIILKERKSKE